jgi:hypothetical protein
VVAARAQLARLVSAPLLLLRARCLAVSAACGYATHEEARRALEANVETVRRCQTRHG